MDDRHAWEQPGAHEEAPGVWRIPLPLPGDSLKAVNVYAVADGDRLVMIDGGWALEGSPELLAGALRSIEYQPGDVREYLVTHVHRDHYTLAVAMRREHGGSVALGEGEKATLDAFYEVTVHPDIAALHEAGALDLSRMLAAWRGERDTTDWEYPDRWLTDGIDVPLSTRTLRVIATPGHTRGHVVFHDPEHGVLFAGDHVLPHITPSLGVELVRPQSPLRLYMDSLATVRALPDARLLPAHGPAVASVHARVDELVRHHEQRLEIMLGEVRKGAATAFEVANAIGWTRRGRAFAELDEFNQMLAVHETVAHLRLLVEHGELTASSADGITHYAVT
ncbi:MAG: MBL fold metallo-hydrolase [Jatrophihabitans sp.]|uniref:MBL fold metallo-hydrolase n=1 Tax=Jatrophihabitans sp. TaxID=1932789 RepID=UPI003F7DB08D